LSPPRRPLSRWGGGPVTPLRSVPPPPACGAGRRRSALKQRGFASQAVAHQNCAQAARRRASSGSARPALKQRDAARRAVAQEKGARRPVSRVLFRAEARRRSFLWTGHCWTVLATYPGVSGGEPCGPKSARHPYSVLLQAGLAMPSLSPATRWALTPPFHPYLRRGGLLSVALSLGSPRAEVIRRLLTVEPGLSSTRASPRRDRPAV